mmetsp:Transcript_19728/g.16890  ORF Transcript_19728/g.16890 Transcript_19728/m.16890 type:complete len:143 (-) Transcript_19728:11-439(-)
MVDGTKKTGDPFTSNNVEVYNALEGDNLNSSSLGYVNSVLKEIKGLFYAGNFDARNGIIGQNTWISSLDSPYNSVLEANRNIFYVDGQPVGTYSLGENFTAVMIYFSGTYVSHWTPASTKSMLDYFFEGKFSTASLDYKPIN